MAASGPVVNPMVLGALASHRVEQAELRYQFICG